MLSTVPGIGKKSSLRIIIELKDSFERLIEDKIIGIEATREERKIIMDDQILYIDPKLRKIVPKIYKKYENTLRKRNLIDLDYILLLTLKILEENKELQKTNFKHQQPN